MLLARDVSEFGSDALEEIFGCLTAHFDDKVVSADTNSWGSGKREMRGASSPASDFDFVL